MSKRILFHSRDETSVWPESTYLTVFSVERLEGLQVLQQDAVGQASVLQINLHKVWQWPRCLYSEREDIIVHELQDCFLYKIYMKMIWRLT